MNRITNRFLGIAIPVVLVAVAVLFLTKGTAAPAAALPDPNAMANVGDGRRSNDDIVALWERKVAANPESAATIAALASAQLTQAGDEGDLEGYELGEETARRAVELDPDDESAALALASAVAGQHDFAEAASIAESILAATPDSVGALLALGDARLELGDEAAAETAYRSALAEVGPVPAIRSRLARVEAITGDPVVARDLARDALVDAAEIDLRPADAAFYWFQLGAYEFALGETEAAESALRSALDIDPANLGASELLGRVLGALGRHDQAIEVYEDLIATGPAADLHGELAKLYRLVDREADADEQIAIGLELAREDADRFPAERRHLISFLADHDPSEALRLAALDLEERQDVRSHAWYAWALYQTGDIDAAAEAIEPALVFDTQDALLRYQAGTIILAAGDIDRGRELLESALDLNGGFDVEHGARAEAQLDLLTELGS